VNAPVAAWLLIGLSACLASACSDSDDGSAAVTTEQSWDCIAARQVTGFTTGTPVADARIVLTRLSDDPDLSQAERDYYADLGFALEDLPDEARLGSSLDDVECPLG